ncbi:MAG: asparaginase domain-containing protein [Acidimicrobiia bacterium]|nr:asparaginase domain-containing protein [Acidimicrobiia bacterium]
MRFHLALISTGGTIEKTYQPRSGELRNETSVLDHMLVQLELPEMRIERIPLMNVDSLDMVDADHLRIAATALETSQRVDGVIVVHGTDRLAESGEVAYAHGMPETPVVFTGAMRPYELRNTDAMQNLTEAMLAVRILAPGVYVAMHNKVLRFPGVRKDHAAGTFVTGA